MSMTTQNPQVIFTGELAGLPPCENTTTVIQVSGGGTLPGTPVALPGSTLPANFKWADRSVVLFADWPDLKATFDAGLLDVLPAEATDEEKAAQPRKWVLNGCGTGLFLPDIGGRFARDWRPGQSDDAGREAGTRQGDAIRNIAGEVTLYINKNWDQTGVFEKSSNTHSQGLWATSNVTSHVATTFDASRVVPTADENRPLNDAQPVAIYMGRRAEDLQ